MKNKYVNFFNLIAILINRAVAFDEFKNSQKLVKDEETKICSFIDDIIEKYFLNKVNVSAESGLSISLDEINEILDALDGKTFYYFSALITRLDKIIPDELLYNLLKYDALASKGIEESYFESLNDNYEITGIYILPEFMMADGYPSEKKYKRNSSVGNELQRSLDKIFYVVKEDLKGYIITNAVIDCELKNKDFITIAATPLCNMREGDLLDINYTEEVRNGTRVKLFSAKPRNPDFINERFKKFLEACSGEKDIDIAFGPEILGTEKFNGVDRFGFNRELRELCNSELYTDLPSIIVPPTYVSDSSNVLNIFSDSGEKLGEQHKQAPFDDGKAKEDLSKSKKEIFILHTKAIGRICFIICKDLLIDYADIPVNVLRADLILCPSFSRGSKEFYKAEGLTRRYNCKFIWINCCSAFENRLKKGAFIGMASGVYIPKSARLFECKEGADCNGCFFKVKLPLIKGKERYVDKGIQFKKIKL